MSTDIRGTDVVLAELQRRLGPQVMQPIVDAALRAGAEVFVAELKRQLHLPDTKGYTLDEITLTEPYNREGNRTITVHWRGPHGRYRIIHLNEFGTVKNPNPRRKGAIARALQASERAYENALRTTIGARM